MKLNLLLSTCLKMMMSMIIGRKCNKCPGIYQKFERFLEIICINLLNSVKLARNGHMRFLKKGLQKPAVPLDSMFLWTGSIIICFPKVRLRYTVLCLV